MKQDSKQKITGYDWEKAKRDNEKRNAPKNTPMSRGSVNGNA